MKIILQTGYLLDESFEGVLKNQPIIEKFLGPMQESWDELGPDFLQTTCDLVKKEFRLKEILAYLILHPNVFSCSHPFLINIKRFRDFDSSILAHKMKFRELVFHEAIHIFLDDNFSSILDERSSSATPLIKKHERLGPVALAHLHLYALQKQTFDVLGLQEEWQKVCDAVKFAHSDGYQKAIEAVNGQGAMPFIEELL